MLDKLKIKEVLFSISNQVVLDLKERISGNKELVSLDSNDTVDPEDFSHQNESAEMNQLLEVQLEKALKEHSKLESIDFSSKQNIEFGSIVTTDKFSFVIGIATIPFQVNGNQFVGISIDAPIYSMMKDKKEGDDFQYGNNHYKIVTIN